MPPDLFAHPIPLLRALYPGSFPEKPLRPETPPERLPGALLATEEAADYLAISPETLRRLCRQKAEWLAILDDKHPVVDLAHSLCLPRGELKEKVSSMVAERFQMH